MCLKMQDFRTNFQGSLDHHGGPTGSGNRIIVDLLPPDYHPGQHSMNTPSRSPSPPDHGLYGKSDSLKGWLLNYCSLK